jgi:hypothetical protein
MFTEIGYRSVLIEKLPKERGHVANVVVHGNKI